MRITTKTSYGLEALYDLAFHCSGRAAQAREIAVRQEIPLRYLEQILQDLRRAGIVGAKRGPRGGYVLAKAPEDVRLLDVVEAVEGSFDPLRADVKDARAGKSTAKSTARNDRTSGPPGLVWRELEARLAALCAGLTLGDFVTRASALGLRPVAPTPDEPDLVQ